MLSLALLIYLYYRESICIAFLILLTQSLSISRTLWVCILSTFHLRFLHFLLPLQFFHCLCLWHSQFRFLRLFAFSVSLCLSRTTASLLSLSVFLWLSVYFSKASSLPHSVSLSPSLSLSPLSPSLSVTVCIFTCFSLFLFLYLIPSVSLFLSISYSFSVYFSFLYFRLSHCVYICQPFSFFAYYNSSVKNWNFPFSFHLTFLNVPLAADASIY